MDFPRYLKFQTNPVVVVAHVCIEIAKKIEVLANSASGDMEWLQAWQAVR